MSNSELSYGKVGSLRAPTKWQSFAGYESRPVKGTDIGDLPPVVQEPTSTEAEKQAFILLPGLQAELAQCKKDLEASKREAADYKKTNLNIEEGIKKGILVIENRTLVDKKISGGQRKTKSKKSKKSKKRKYKRSKHRHTKKPN